MIINFRDKHYYCLNLKHVVTHEAADDNKPGSGECTVYLELKISIRFCSLRVKCISKHDRFTPMTLIVYGVKKNWYIFGEITCTFLFFFRADGHTYWVRANIRQLQFQPNIFIRRCSHYFYRLGHFNIREKNKHTSGIRAF